MNSKGQIGQILTSFPSLIFVFVIMLLFVMVSGYIARDTEFKENLLDDFLSDYIILNGKVVTVREAIQSECSEKIIEDSLKTALKEHFIEEYGERNAFALVSKNSGGPGGWSYVLHSWSGAFIDKIGQDQPKIPRFEFHDVFSLEQRKFFCDDSFQLYLKSGGSNGP